MKKIITYTKGGIKDAKLEPKTDVIISLTDYANKPVLFSSEFRTLSLSFDDVNDDTLSKTEQFVANRLTKEKHISRFSFIFNEGWPVMPFTPYHAKEIIRFIEETGSSFEKNWHIHCEYGRSRSVAIALFLSQMFPKNELILMRDVSRPNRRVMRLLNKEWGLI